MANIPLRVTKYIVTDHSNTEITGMSLYNGESCKIIKAAVGMDDLEKLRVGSLFIERIWLEKRQTGVVECKQITFTDEYFLTDVDEL